MAELGLAVVGLALAWKGVMDFGELISKLVADDGWRQEGLAMRLEASHFLLKEWGDYWQVTQDGGRFDAFEPSKKELIGRIVLRLRDSRADAQKRLKEFYGLGADKDDANGGDSHRRLTRIVARVKGASKTARDKTVWLMHDHDLITDLVNETVELHACLNYLTTMSPTFLLAREPSVRSAPTLESGLLRLESKVDEISQNLPRRTLVSTSQGDADLDIDDRTMAGYTTKSITSTAQIGRILELLETAREHDGDARIPEKIASWWTDSCAGERMLVLEGQDMSEDTTFACVLLFHLVPCHKLIHSFDPESESRPLVQFVQMLRNLIQSVVVSRESPSLEEVPVSFSMADTDANDVATGERYTSVLLGLLRNLVRSERQLLLIFDRMDLVSSEDNREVALLAGQFVAGLKTLCDSPRATLKVLIGHNGHAMALYGDDNGHIVDLTDHALETTNMQIALASGIRDWDFGRTTSG